MRFPQRVLHPQRHPPSTRRAMPTPIYSTEDTSSVTQGCIMQARWTTDPWTTNQAYTRVNSRKDELKYREHNCGMRSCLTDQILEPRWRQPVRPDVSRKYSMFPPFTKPLAPIYLQASSRVVLPAHNPKPHTLGTCLRSTDRLKNSSKGSFEIASQKA